MEGTTTIFSNTYQRYKSYTSEVSKWLMDTAGYDWQPPKQTSKPDPSKNNGASIATGRLKGKARKLAKAAPVDKEADKKLQAEVSLPVDQLLELGHCISRDPKKMSKIPKNIISKLEVTICLRQEYAALYAVRRTTPEEIDSSSRVRLQQDNLTHAYFVQTLQRLLRILRPEAPSPSTREPPQSCSPENPSALCHDPSQASHNLNSFHLLNIEDMETDDKVVHAQESLQPEKKTHQSPKPIHQPKTVLREKDEDAEIYFATYCLFSDFRRLQLLIRDHWQKYKNREIGLETVTFMSNMAIVTLRNIEREFLISFGRHFEVPTYAEISRRLLCYVGAQRGFDLTGLDDIGHPHHEEMPDIEELIGFHAYSAFNPLLWSISDPDNFEMPDPCPGTYDRHADRSEMDPEEILDQDQELLIELFAHCSIFKRQKAPSGYQDEFTKLMRRLNRDDFQVHSITIVFATQIFLDISSLLGPEISRPFEELQLAAKQMNSSLNRFFDFRKRNPEHGGWHESIDESLIWFQEKMLNDRLTDDPMSKLKAQDALGHPTPVPDRPYQDKDTDNEDEDDDGDDGDDDDDFDDDDSEDDDFEDDYFEDDDSEDDPPLSLHQQHPLLCGTELLGLRLTFHGIGINACHGWGSLLHTVHAYNTFRATGALDLSWPLMESLISHFTPEKLFAGCRPKALGDCLKKFVLHLHFHLQITPSPFPLFKSLYLHLLS